MLEHLRGLPGLPRDRRPNQRGTRRRGHGDRNFRRSQRENQKTPRGAWCVWREEAQTKKLYRVFISYRQPYKTRRWLLFSAESMEEVVARLQLVAKTGIVSYVRIERREP